LICCLQSEPVWLFAHAAHDLDRLLDGLGEAHERVGDVRLALPEESVVDLQQVEESERVVSRMTERKERRTKMKLFGM
jgi:hypothetical protein